MDKEKTDDVQYIVTCAYCGAQTALSFKQLENNQPLKCRVCGAPLKIAPPPKRPAKKRKRRSCDYYLLHAERVEYERRLDGEKQKVATVAVIVVYAAAVISAVLTFLIKKC